jgi:co-chaperonin GroES (HSP10)
VKFTGKIPALTECDPGFRPTEYNILIAPEELQEKIGSLYLPEQTKEKEGMALMRGRLIAASPLAFTYSDAWADGERPKPGDAVIFAKFAGVLIEGRDGKEYRLAKDKDLAAVLEE